MSDERSAEAPHRGAARRAAADLGAERHPGFTDLDRALTADQRPCERELAGDQRLPEQVCIGDGELVTSLVPITLLVHPTAEGSDQAASELDPIRTGWLVRIDDCVERDEVRLRLVLRRRQMADRSPALVSI